MIELTGNTLTRGQPVAIARRRGARWPPWATRREARMSASHAWVADAIRGQGKTIYGVNTGFGSLANKQISEDEARQLSRNLILLCMVGVGGPLPDEIVLCESTTIRANMLAKGHSGVRPVVAQTLIDMLYAGVTPAVPAKGSLGASGDLTPLAHIAAVLTRAVGDGDADGRAAIPIAAIAVRPGRGRTATGAEAMARAGSSGWSWRRRKGWRCRTVSTSWPWPACWRCMRPKALWRTRRRPSAQLRGAAGPHRCIRPRSPGSQRAAGAAPGRRPPARAGARQPAGRLCAGPCAGRLQPALHPAGVRTDPRSGGIRARAL